MKTKLIFILVQLTFLSTSIFAQLDFESNIKFMLGFNRSELSPSVLATENVNGGIGWNAELNYSIVFDKFFVETGLGYRKLNFLTSENLSQTQKFSTKANSLSLPILIGTNLISNENPLRPIVKTGFRLDYLLNLTDERAGVLTKEDFGNFNLTYEFDLGFQIANRLELLFACNFDLNKFLTPIDKKNSYTGLKIAYLLKN